MKAWYLANKTKQIERMKQWRIDNRELYRQACREQYKKNPARQLEATKRWEKKNPAKRRAIAKAYAEAHPGKMMHHSARKRAEKRAMPTWANPFFIEEAYLLARLRSELTGVPHTVDHIVPLNSKRVCGLHVENNLRVIPKTLNCAKGNRYWPDMPSKGEDLFHGS